MNDSSKNKTNKILITGATGFIGNHLARSLTEKGENIRCLVRKSSRKEAIDYLNSLGVELSYGDLLDKHSLETALEDIDTVFHLGGGGRISMSKETQDKINIEGTKNILDACLKQKKIKRFIHISTCAVMGDIKGNTPGDETYPPNPSNLAYSKAKTEAEKIALSYKDKIPLVVVRFPGVYGIPLRKGDADDIGGVTPVLMIFSAIKNSQWRYIGDGKNYVHLFHVDDAVNGLELAAKKGVLGEIYIIGDRKSIRMDEMVEIGARLLNVENPKGHIPVSVAKFFATFFELKAKIFGGTPQMSREMITGFIGNLYIDTSKARRKLGYEPKVSLEEGMKSTIKWFEKNEYL